MRRVRVATYQSASGAGADAMERLRATSTDDTDLAMDWDFDGEEFDEEAKLRDETRKILELPELPIHAQCVRVPVMVGHAEAVWVETEDALSPDDARRMLGAAPGVRLVDFPTPKQAEGIDDVLVGRIRRDTTERERAQPVRRLRQPAQGRRVERDPDRRAPARAQAARRSSPEHQVVC